MNNLITISGVRGFIDGHGTAQLNLEDVARGLGFTQIAASGNESIRWERVNKYLDDFGFIPTRGDAKFIPENIFYRLAMKAKNAAAETFQAKVADEILPAIRKTGTYSVIPQTFSEALRLAADQAEQLEQQKPLVAFANQVSSTSDSLDIGAFSKVIHDQHINIGRNKLFKWFRGNGYLRSNNEPYQKYIETGLFKVIIQVKETPYGSKEFTKTLITGKGQIYFVEKLREIQ